MKVYKKDIYNFLEKVEAKAVASVHKDYQKRIDESKRERSKEFMVKKNQITAHLESALAKLEELAIIHHDIHFVSYSDYVSGQRNLMNAIRSLNKSSHTDIVPNPDEKQLIVERDQLLADVQKEYAKLNAYCKENKAIDSYNMLIELGFDVSSIPTSDRQIIAKADKSKLFVCGERK